MIKVTKLLILTVATVAVLAIAAMLVMARPAVVLGVSGSTLAYSVDQGPYGQVCRKDQGDDWTCRLEGDRAMTRYRVDVRWDGCWQAERTAGPVTRFTPAALSGCIGIIDVVKPQLIFD